MIDNYCDPEVVRIFRQLSFKIKEDVLARNDMFDLLAKAEERLVRRPHEKILIAGVRAGNISSKLEKHERCVTWDNRQIKRSGGIPREVGVVLTTRWMDSTRLNRIRAMVADTNALLIECGGRTGVINGFLKRVFSPVPAGAAVPASDGVSVSEAEAESDLVLAESAEIPVNGNQPSPATEGEKQEAVPAEVSEVAVVPSPTQQTPRPVALNVTQTEYIRTCAKFDSPHPTQEIKDLFRAMTSDGFRTSIPTITGLFYREKWKAMKVKKIRRKRMAKPAVKKVEMPPEVAVQLAGNSMGDVEEALTDLTDGAARLRKDWGELIAEVKRLREENTKLRDQVAKSPTEELRTFARKRDDENAKLRAENAELRKIAEIYQKMRSLVAKGDA